MRADETWAELVQALLEIEGIPNMGELDNVEAPYIADALLPVVDRIAKDRAAAELRAAADDFGRPDNGPGGALVALSLTARADALDPS